MAILSKAHELMFIVGRHTGSDWSSDDQEKVLRVYTELNNNMGYLARSKDALAALVAFQKSFGLLVIQYRETLRTNKKPLDAKSLNDLPAMAQSAGDLGTLVAAIHTMVHSEESLLGWSKSAKKS